MQEYYNQLVEDLETRILNNYETSTYNESLFLLKNASPENIKVALVVIFNKNSNQHSTIKKRINDLKYKFPSFSMLKDRKWLEKKLNKLLRPQETSPDSYYAFLLQLGGKLQSQFVRENEMK